MGATRFADIENRINPNRRGALTEEELWDVIDSVCDSYFLGNEDGDTIDECMSYFFDRIPAEWIAFQSKDGTCYVNCTGVSNIADEDVEIALQFMMSDDLRSFALVAMTVDGTAQTDEFIEEFQYAFSRK